MTFPDPIDPLQCTPQLRLQILHGLPFFAHLSHEEVRAVDRHFRERGYTPGEPIYHAGEEATHLYVVAAGKIKLVRHTLSGQDVLLDILTPGDYFGALPALGETRYPDSAEAQTACCALAVSAADFGDILQRHPTVALPLLEMTAARLREAQETIRQLSAHSAEQRVAATLLKLGDKLGQQREDDLLIQMPLSRQDVADMTGSTVETASRILSSFRKRGLIRSGRQWIALRDPAALRALATDG
jgi:CRP-like cAMP-binding protein